MSSINNGRRNGIKKSRCKKFKRQEVIKIFKIMENQSTSSSATSNNCGSSNSEGAEAEPNIANTNNNGKLSKDLKNEFFNTGRVGRRNALPDILGAHCTISTADLPTRLSSLTTDDKSSGEPGPSNINLDNSSSLTEQR